MIAARFPDSERGTAEAVVKLCDPSANRKSVESAIQSLGGQRREALERYAGTGAIARYAEVMSRRVEGASEPMELGDVAAKVINSQGGELDSDHLSRLAQVLLEVVRESRIPDATDLSDFVVPVATAKHSLRLLLAAEPHTSDKVRDALRREMVVATWFAEGPKAAKQVQEYIAQLANLNEMPLDVDFVRMLVFLDELDDASVGPKDVADVLPTASRFTANWESLTASHSSSKSQQVAERRKVYTTLIEPVVRVASTSASLSGMDAVAKQHLAALQNFMATTIIEDYGLRRGDNRKTAANLALRCVRQATKMANRNPANPITNARVLYSFPELAGEDLPEQLMTLGRKALALCKGPFKADRPDALNVIAYSNLLSARKAHSFAERHNQLKNTARMFQRIDQLTREEKLENAPDRLLNYSTSLVELAYTSPAERAKYLSVAEKLADRVIRTMSGHRRYDASDAFLSRGHAREDQAHYACDYEQFPKAIKDFRRAFEAALIDDEKSDKARLAEARCRYRWASVMTDKRARLEMLTKAASLLHEKRHLSDDAAQKLREKMWRGQTMLQIALLRKTEVQPALALLKEVARDVGERDPTNWLEFQLAYLESVRTALESRKDSDWGELQRLVDQRIRNPLLKQFVDRQAFVGRLVFLHVRSVTQTAISSGTPAAYRTIFDGFEQKLASLDWLSEEARLELLLGQLDACSTCLEKTGESVVSSDQIQQLWNRYRATLEKAPEAERRFRGFISMARYQYKNGHHENAARNYFQAIPLLRQHGCQSTRDQNELLVEVGQYLAIMQIMAVRNGQPADASAVKTASELLKDPELHPFVLEAFDEEELQMVLEFLENISGSGSD